MRPGTRPELADVERSIVRERGTISPLYQALLNSAPIASGWEKFLTAVRKQTTVPPALRELIILRIAVLNRAPFEFDERLVLELADAMTRDIEVPDALMARIAARFDPRGVLEVVATVAAYNMVSRLLVALRIQHGGPSPSRSS